MRRGAGNKKTPADFTKETFGKLVSSIYDDVSNGGSLPSCMSCCLHLPLLGPLKYWAVFEEQHKKDPRSQHRKPHYHMTLLGTRSAALTFNWHRREIEHSCSKVGQ